MNLSSIIVLILVTLVSFSAADNYHYNELNNFNDSFQLDSFCNPLDGCQNISLTCVKNRCECAPGYGKIKLDEDKCEFIGCQNDSECSKLDPNRKCNNGMCDQCKRGLILDMVVNRCVTMLGYACNQTKNCLNLESDLDDITDNNYGAMPVCRSGRCVCRADYFPSDDWSECKYRKCSSKDECNPFGDDPHRFCSKALHTCVCSLGYYEESRMSVCLPYIPIQYSLMMPFWLTMIMFTICILVYISRRLSRAKSVRTTHTEATTAANWTTQYTVSNDALNRPPPSYDTVVKEPIMETSATAIEHESQPPNYIHALANQQS